MSRFRLAIYDFVHRNRLKPTVQQALGHWAKLHPVRRPVFVVGMNRSGTTILRDCVAATDALVNIREANDIWDPHGYPWEGAGRGRPFWFFQPQDYIDCAFAEAGPGYWNTIPGLCSVRIWSEAGRRSRRRMLCSSPMNTLRISQLHRLFPDACFVSTVRNPLAVLRSWSEKIQAKLAQHPRSGVETGKNGQLIFRIDGREYSFVEAVACAARGYRDVVQKQLDQLREIPEPQKVLLNYETFVEDIHGWCKRIDRHFDLNPARRHWDRIPATQPSRNYKYQEQFSPAVVEAALQSLGPLMSQLGYARRSAAA